MKPIPDWLNQHKNEWRSEKKMRDLIAIKGMAFTTFFGIIKPRLKDVFVPCANGLSRKYLVKHVWAMSLAHGVEVIRPTKDDSAEVIAALSIEVAQLRSTVARMEKANDLLKAAKNDYLGVVTPLLAGMHEPLPISGVYVLRDSSERVVYVGQSNNVLARMAGHVCKDFASVRMFGCADPQSRLFFERTLIKALLPKLNVIGKPRTTKGLPEGIAA